MSSVFRFKEFEVIQDQTAMKIGTDSVLLGAWAQIEHDPKSILDIGAGTGVIALQLAQRSTAELIDAVELDTGAFENCVTNFENSPWNDRLFCYHASLQEFAAEIDDVYDLITANPPYFEPQNQINDASRAKARFTDSLSYQDLLKAVKQLLSDHGIFSVIIPFQSEAKFIKIAHQHQLVPTHILHLKGRSNAPYKRSLINFSCKSPKPTEVSELVIEHERHHYTKDYINLTKDFYLKL